MSDIDHSGVSAVLATALSHHEADEDPVIYALAAIDGNISMLELRSLSLLFATARTRGLAPGPALEMMASFVPSESPADLGIPFPKSLVGIAIVLETWMVDAKENPVSLDLGKMLTSERRLGEHPDAITAIAAWAHCTDGTGHEAVLRENETAPRQRLIPPGDRQWPVDAIPAGLRQLLNAIPGRSMFRLDPRS